VLASLLLNRYVLGFIGVLAVVAGLALGWYQLKEKYRNEGRAEIQLAFDAYKAEVQQAAAKSKAENDALTAKNAALAGQLAKRIGSSLEKLTTSAKEAQRVIETTPTPDCALPSGVLNAVNAARSSAAAEIDRAYKPKGAVQ